MIHHLKISHRQYSGQLRPHEHTSYLPLALLVFAVGLLLAALTSAAYAQSPSPQAGSIGLSGSKPAPAPMTTAPITSPKDGQRFNSLPITVSGTCPAETLVVIYKNDIFAGSTMCEENGTFSTKIDLLFGKNVLKTRVYDALNQAGPESKPVTVYYDTPLPEAAAPGVIDFTGTQLLLNTDAVFRGKFPNEQLNVPITVIGGTAPFAINVQWGDSTNQVIPRGNNSTFNASHTYEKPGTYKITLQGSDSKQLFAYLSVAAIINGTPAEIITATSDSLPKNRILMLWPAYAVIATAVISFWLGERREKHILGGKSNQPPISPFGSSPQPPAQKA